MVAAKELGDSPMAAELLRQISSHEEVPSFTGDGAYDTKDVHEECHEREALSPSPPPQRSVSMQRTGSRSQQ